MPRVVSFGGRILYKAWSRVTSYSGSTSRFERGKKSRADGVPLEKAWATTPRPCCSSSSSELCTHEDGAASPGSDRNLAHAHAHRRRVSSPRRIVRGGASGRKFASLQSFGARTRGRNFGAIWKGLAGIRRSGSEKRAREKHAGWAHFCGVSAAGQRGPWRMKQCPARSTDRRPSCSAAEMPGGSNKWPPG